MAERSDGVAGEGSKVFDRGSAVSGRVASVRPLADLAGVAPAPRVVPSPPPSCVSDRLELAAGEVSTHEIDREALDDEAIVGLAAEREREDRGLGEVVGAAARVGFVPSEDEIASIRFEQAVDEDVEGEDGQRQEEDGERKGRSGGSARGGVGGISVASAASAFRRASSLDAGST